MTEISWPKLAGIVGRSNLREATGADAIDGITPRMVCEPDNAEDLAQALRWARDAGLKVSPRGGGTKMGWGNRPTRCDLVMSTIRLNHVLEHAWSDMTVIVQAGCRVADLQRTLAEHGQRLALDPLWPEQATIGGILSTNDSGTLRARYGSLRDLIIGITVVLADGTIAKSGGKVVKNVAGYDLSKLFTGGFGTLGIIVEAVFRLYPLPRQVRSLSFAGTPQSLNQLLLGITSSKLTFTGLQMRATSSNAELDIRLEGTAAGVEAQIKQALQIAGTASSSNPPEEVWNSREALWIGGSPALVARFSVLPTKFTALCEAIERTAAKQDLTWKMVGQSIGTGCVRLEGNEPALRNALLILREAVAKMGGSIVALGCPEGLKRGLDVWGAVSDAQPLMVRIKQRFDPDGTLNPGRYVGGI
jgi:glycolate oxidase FAD binding subunit